MKLKIICQERSGREKVLIMSIDKNIKQEKKRKNGVRESETKGTIKGEIRNSQVYI